MLSVIVVVVIVYQRCKGFLIKVKHSPNSLCHGPGKLQHPQKMQALALANRVLHD